jgi:polyhydroxybutyrate depolymerase
LWIALLLCVGCAATPPAPPETRTVTVRTADGDRGAIVHRAASAAPGAPLVVVLHGARGSAADMRAKLGWDALADREGFVVAYPDGLDRTWNAGRCCGSARDRRVDDVAFLDELVATLRQDDGVGTVYAVGFSNGAMMSYAWACARPGALAGIGPVAGALTVDCPAPAPLTVVAVHGSRDERVPIGGGRGPSGVDFRSFDASLAPFRTAAACPTTGTVVDAAPARVDDRACAGHAVVSDVVDGFTHVWPGAGPTAGTTTGPLDATGFLWAHLHG